MTRLALISTASLLLLASTTRAQAEPSDAPSPAAPEGASADTPASDTDDAAPATDAEASADDAQPADDAGTNSAAPSPDDAQPADAAGTSAAPSPDDAQPAEAAPASEPHTTRPPPSARAELDLSSEGMGASAGGNLAIDALVGGGLSFETMPGDINPFGFGLGLRVGYSIQQIYLGARGQYHFGGSADLPSGKVSASTWTIGAEGGYDVPVGQLTLRPSLVLGLATRTVDGPQAFVDPDAGAIPGTSDSTDHAFYLSPGASVLLPLDVIAKDLDMLVLGADLRVPLIFGNDLEVGLLLLGTLGVRL